MFNCTTEKNPKQNRAKCADVVKPKQLAQKHRQARGVESLAKMVFLLGEALFKENVGPTW